VWGSRPDQNRSTKRSTRKPRSASGWRYGAVVTPTSTSFVREPGVTNYYIQDRRRFDPVGHIGIAADTGVTSMILNGLDPAAPVRCGVGLPI